ncbi:MAG: hypothetical protein HGA45_39155, partial [Chloroflexales bacterium]|nr:hypothetical protein [Chloroflexales bacterium]
RKDEKKSKKSKKAKTRTAAKADSSRTLSRRIVYNRRLKNKDAKNYAAADMFWSPVGTFHSSFPVASSRPTMNFS